MKVYKTMECQNSILIAGLDEVGMGCLAGPVVVCVAAFEESIVRIGGVRDSKTTTRQQRKKAVDKILGAATFVGLGYATSGYINRFGLVKAWQHSCDMALEHSPPFKRLIIDGLRGVSNYAGPMTVKPKADVTDWQVSAASIIAKVIRDSHMNSLSPFYPSFDWSRNAGYGTKKHIEELKRVGPSPFHRDKFIRKILGR